MQQLCTLVARVHAIGLLAMVIRNTERSGVRASSVSGEVCHCYPSQAPGAAHFT